MCLNKFTLYLSRAHGIFEWDMSYWLHTWHSFPCFVCTLYCFRFSTSRYVSVMLHVCDWKNMWGGEKKKKLGKCATIAWCGRIFLFLEGATDTHWGMALISEVTHKHTETKLLIPIHRSRTGNDDITHLRWIFAHTKCLCVSVNINSF